MSLWKCKVDKCHCACCEESSKRETATEHRFVEIESNLHRLLAERFSRTRSTSTPTGLSADQLRLRNRGLSPEDQLHFSDCRYWKWHRWAHPVGWRKKDVRTREVYGPIFSYISGDHAADQARVPPPFLTPLMLALLFHRAATVSHPPPYRRAQTERALDALNNLGLVAAEFPSCHYVLTESGKEYVRRVQSRGLTI